VVVEVVKFRIHRLYEIKQIVSKAKWLRDISHHTLEHENKKVEKSFDFMVTDNNSGEIFFSPYFFISGPKWKISNSSQFDSESKTGWEAGGYEVDASISDTEDNTLLKNTSNDIPTSFQVSIDLLRFRANIRSFFKCTTRFTVLFNENCHYEATSSDFCKWDLFLTSVLRIKCVFFALIFSVSFYLVLLVLTLHPHPIKHTGNSAISFPPSPLQCRSGRQFSSSGSKARFKMQLSTAEGQTGR
jgi:hypothetical protein